MKLSFGDNYFLNYKTCQAFCGSFLNEGRDLIESTEVILLGN